MAEQFMHIGCPVLGGPGKEPWSWQSLNYWDFAGTTLALRAQSFGPERILMTFGAYDLTGDIKEIVVRYRRLGMVMLASHASAFGSRDDGRTYRIDLMEFTWVRRRYHFMPAHWERRGFEVSLALYRILGGDERNWPDE